MSLHKWVSVCLQEAVRKDIKQLWLKWTVQVSGNMMEYTDLKKKRTIPSIRTLFSGRSPVSFHYTLQISFTWQERWLLAWCHSLSAYYGPSIYSNLHLTFTEALGNIFLISMTEESPSILPCFIQPKNIRWVLLVDPLSKFSFHTDLLVICAVLTQLCPTCCDPMDSGPPGTSVPGILQARILESWEE